MSNGTCVKPGARSCSPTKIRPPKNRDPVAPAKRSKTALRKLQSKHLDDGTPVHSFATLNADLASIVRNACRTPWTGDTSPSFQVMTTPSASQHRAMNLINAIQL